MALLVTGTGLLIGTVVLVAQADGAGRPELAGRIWRLALLIAAALGTLFAVVLMAGEPILLLLGQEPDVRQAGECLDVGQCFRGGERRGEDPRVGGHPQIGDHGRPAEAEQVGSGRRSFQETTGGGVNRARRVGSVEQDVHVDGEAHGSAARSGRSRMA